jgi:hypothetical protein
MKSKAAERSVFGSKMIDSMERESVETEIIHAKWLVWQGKGSKGLERIKTLDSRLLAREGYEFNTLWWNLNNVSSYLKKNVRTLVIYGARHRKGRPISSGIAESAVNEVVSYRMAKKRQMRRTDEGAHCMAQVRVAVLNGEFSPRRIPARKIAASRCDACVRAASAGENRSTHRTDGAIAASHGCPTKATSPTLPRSRLLAMQTGSDDLNATSDRVEIAAHIFGGSEMDDGIERRALLLHLGNVLEACGCVMKCALRFNRGSASQLSPMGSRVDSFARNVLRGVARVRRFSVPDAC